MKVVKVWLCTLFVFLFPALSGCAGAPHKDLNAIPIWHKLTLDFEGPAVDEQAEQNPFMHYRMDVLFKSPTGQSFLVPGFFAADGHAAQTGAGAGNVWRVHFSPNELGRWTYKAMLKQGPKAAIDQKQTQSAGFFDGRKGGFTVVHAAAALPEHSFKNKGKLAYVGEHFLQFQGNQSFFLKAGVNSPEVLLGYQDFDATPSARTYAEHAKDWRTGDPTWRDGKGKGLIGLVNYVASLNNNAMYFLLMSVDGDGKETWPWTAPYEFTRYDVSKLAQWALVFDHMNDQGVMPHFVLTETENEHFFEWYEDKKLGGFADSRKLYYREMMARFGYLLAATWNVGEEHGWADPKSLDYGTGIETSTEQRKAFADYLQGLAWYPEHIVIHNGPSRDYKIYNKPGDNIAGYPAYTGASVQGHVGKRKMYEDTLMLRKLSAAQGQPWVVTLDEPYEKNKTLQPLDDWRIHTVWATLMAGGAGVELYLGGGLDLTEQNLRPYQDYYQTAAAAIEFFQQQLPFTELTPVEAAFDNAWLLAKEGEIYVLYFPQGGTADLSLPQGDFELAWYSPAEKRFYPGSVIKMQGNAVHNLGYPLQSTQTKDWLAVVRKVDENK